MKKLLGTAKKRSLIRYEANLGNDTTALEQELSDLKSRVESINQEITEIEEQLQPYKEILEKLNIAIPNKPYMTPDEYLAWEEKQELRYEYVDGVVYARNEIYGMTGGTLPHKDIALNLYSVLRSPM